jgi:two-component system chemotaxis sensor kinase CheA
VEQHDDPQLMRAAKQLNHLTGKLQENILQTRMQPVQTLWNRMPRLVRDVAQMCTKEVTLKMTGGETEIDRSVMDAIKDPLTHLLRNAVDHGIEAPEKRSQLGKSRSGTIHLHSQYSNGQVVISIRDDGGGIAPQKVLKRAIEKGMISSLDAGRMSKDEIIQLIFLPGFSTAEKVSEVSGRGVGMDVVRSNIESIGGVIEIKSVENEGSEIRLKIPLTLAIVQGLIVGVHDQRMIVPQSSLVEIVHLDELECLERVTQIENGSVLQYRGNLIPMVRIESVLELELDPSESVTELTVLILQFESSLIGLIVPRIFDTEEIVIKGLSSDLTSLKIYSGATILGDGSIALVLDVHQLLSPYVFGGCSRGVVDPTPSDSNRHSAEGAVMLVESAGRRFAIQIREIKRMELVQHNSIQKTTRGEMIPHRGAILPVYRLGQNQDSTGNTAHDQSASLLVVEANAKEQGVLVERVVDICPADRIEYEDTETSMGLVDGIVTEFISIFDWLSVTAPSPNDYSSMEG